MKNYIIESNNNIHYIFESKTSQVVHFGKNLPAIKKLTNKLNGGSGFNGDTPPFFAKKV